MAEAQNKRLKFVPNSLIERWGTNPRMIKAAWSHSQHTRHTLRSQNDCKWGIEQTTVMLKLSTFIPQSISRTSRLTFRYWVVQVLYVKYLKWIQEYVLKFLNKAASDATHGTRLRYSITVYLGRNITLLQRDLTFSITSKQTYKHI